MKGLLDRCMAEVWVLLSMEWWWWLGVLFVLSVVTWDVYWLWSHPSHLLLVVPIFVIGLYAGHKGCLWLLKRRRRDNRCP